MEVPCFALDAFPGRHGRLFSPDRLNFDPRFNLAWSPARFHGNTVVRTGFGIYHGAADPVHGIREIVVGTGGRNHTPLGTPVPNSEVRNTDTYGVLKLTLHARSYDWEFVPEAGKTFTDSGSGVCH